MTATILVGAVVMIGAGQAADLRAKPAYLVTPKASAWPIVMCQFGPSCKGSKSRYSRRVKDDRQPVVVTPYDPDWPRRFEAERAVLEDVLRLWLKGGIHHIGSTAIPGMAAKPIIDMMAGVRDLDEARAAFTPLGLHSYYFAPHRPGTHHFFKPPGPWWTATHGLHLTEPGSDLWRERLAFRNALRADPALAAEYADLKMRLAQEHGTEVERYTVGKRAFVGRVLGGVGLTLPPTSPR